MGEGVGVGVAVGVGVDVGFPVTVSMDELVERGPTAVLVVLGTEVVVVDEED